VTPEEISELQNSNQQLLQRIEAIEANKTAILEEKRKTAEELKALREKEAQRESEELERKGELQTLLEQERSTSAELKKSLEEAEKARQKERIEANFTSVFASEAHSPSHVWQIFGSSVARESGKTTVEYKGAKIPLSELPEKLRGDSDYSYLLKPKGVTGMGSKPGTSVVVDAASENPYMPGGSITRRIQLEMDNPDLADRLKAEAKAAQAGN
jgi:hypothetical protein